MKTWLVFDCDYICHWTGHAMSDLTHNGSATGVIFGVLKYVQGLQESFGTSNIVFCWDSKVSKRKEIFSEYKANRKDDSKGMSDDEIKVQEDLRLQMKKLRTEYLLKIGYRNVFWQKGYEADDMIASVCQNLPEGDMAIIVSADKDLFQLIQHNVSTLNPRSRKGMTLQGFRKLYGIYPHEWKLVKAIAGCSTDNVPGVKGIGERTVLKYLKGDLDSRSKLYERIVCREGQKLVARNLKLVSLPFVGVNTFKLNKDELSQKGWDEVTKSFGLESIKDSFPRSRRRHKMKQKKAKATLGVF